MFEMRKECPGDAIDATKAHTRARRVAKAEFLQDGGRTVNEGVHP